MFPRWHILYGLIFSILFWIVFPATAWHNMAIIFLASFFIDFDHYTTAVWKTGKWSLPKAYDYYMKLNKKMLKEKEIGIFRKGDFHIFHTLEFHGVVFMLGFAYSVFFYIFIGMAIHSLIDFVDLTYRKELYKREFFLTKWIRRRIETRFTRN